MASSEDWPLLHDYRRMVRRGLAEPIRCPQDDTELVPTIYFDNEPALRCLTCRVVYTIGLDMLDQMRAVVDGTGRDNN